MKLRGSAFRAFVQSLPTTAASPCVMVCGIIASPVLRGSRWVGGGCFGPLEDSLTALVAALKQSLLRPKDVDTMTTNEDKGGKNRGNNNSVGRRDQHKQPR